MIFAATVGVNLKVIAKISNAEFQPRIYRHYVFDIGDHPTAVKCLPIAAESFRWMSGFKWKFSESPVQSFKWTAETDQAQWIYIRWLGRCGWAAKSQRGSQSGWRREALPNETLDKFRPFQSLLADSQEYHGLRSAIPTLRFAPVPKHSCKRSHVSWMLTSRCQRS